jgi:hypothetical protein
VNSQCCFHHKTLQLLHSLFSTTMRKVLLLAIFLCLQTPHKGKNITSESSQLEAQQPIIQYLHTAIYIVGTLWSLDRIHLQSITCSPIPLYITTPPSSSSSSFQSNVQSRREQERIQKELVHMPVQIIHTNGNESTTSPRLLHWMAYLMK